MKKKLFRGNLFLLLILVMLLSASCGRNRATTMKLIKTDGEVGVENEKGKSVDLIENLGLYSGYGIGTQKKSFAWIDLDDTKLTKMDEKSDVDIKKDGKKLELVVNSGGLFFNVTKPLEDDESMDIRTSTTICGIRGTCGWVEAYGDTTYVGLFDGKVECTVTADGKEETVRVNAKEILIVKKDGDHVTYEVKKLTYKDVPEFVQVEIADEPFALEEESYAVEDFLGVYSNSDGEYAREVELGLDDDGALYFRHGNSINQSYSSYEVDGNIITGTYQDYYTSETFTDTFTLNEDGSLTAELSDERYSSMNMTFDFEREISEQEERSDVVDINDYIGTFMNGEDSGAGRLTISEIDPQSVNVRFEASGDFGTKNGVSIVFEETGYSFENGIYIDVSGKRVEFTKGTKHDGTYVLDVPEPLKQEWNLLESVYEKEYSLMDTVPEETSEIDRFLGTYTKDFGSYKEALILTVREDGLLYWNAGNSYHGGWMGDRYTEYSINGDELKATNEGGTDTFILDADGSITATFSALDFYNGVYERNDGYDETEEYPGGYP